MLSEQTRHQPKMKHWLSFLFLLRTATVCGMKSAAQTNRSLIELYTPTKAAMLPPFLTLAQLLGYEHLQKLTYIKLNIQTPCPPGGAVPVHTRAWLGGFHSARPVRFRAWMRLSQLCRGENEARRVTVNL
jgi:hypothetical protein